MKLLYDPVVSERKNTGLADCSDDFPDLHYADKNDEKRLGPRHLKDGGYSPSTIAQLWNSMVTIFTDALV